MVHIFDSKPMLTLKSESDRSSDKIAFTYQISEDHVLEYRDVVASWHSIKTIYHKLQPLSGVQALLSASCVALAICPGKFDPSIVLLIS